MKKMFPVTSSFEAGGWIIPDGSILDFNKNYHNKDKDDWDEHGDIGKAFSKERKAEIQKECHGPSDIYIKSSDEAVNLGAIRYGSAPAGIFMDIGREPTDKQYEQIEAYINGNVWHDPNEVEEHYIRFVDDNSHLRYSDEETLQDRLVSDIKRHYNRDNRHEETPDSYAVRMFHSND